MNQFIEMLIGKLEEISEPIRPVGWSRKIEAVETKAVIDIVMQLAEDYNNGWRSTELEIPLQSDEILLVQCNGRYKNTVFHNALELASYTEEGWILDHYPEFENVEVIAWQPLPPAFKPKGD